MLITIIILSITKKMIILIIIIVVFTKTKPKWEDNIKSKIIVKIESKLKFKKLKDSLKEVLFN